MTTWERAQELRARISAVLPSMKVELSPNPAANIGGLHQTAAEIRSKSNQVRDALWAVMHINMELRREAADASWAYDQAVADTTKANVDNQAIKQLKTKEEREMAIRQLVVDKYQTYIDTKTRLEEWDQFVKMVNLVYYSLSHTRDDLNTQVAVIRQQMFNGEIKPNKDLGNLSSLADLLGAEAKKLLNDESGIPGQTNGEVAFEEASHG